MPIGMQQQRCDFLLAELHNRRPLLRQAGSLGAEVAELLGYLPRRRSRSAAANCFGLLCDLHGLESSTWAWPSSCLLRRSALPWRCRKAPLFETLDESDILPRRYRCLAGAGSLSRAVGECAEVDRYSRFCQRMLHLARWMAPISGAGSNWWRCAVTRRPPALLFHGRGGHV